MSTHISNESLNPDQVRNDIANDVADFTIGSDEAWNASRLCLIDTFG